MIIVTHDKKLNIKKYFLFTKKHAIAIVPAIIFSVSINLTTTLICLLLNISINDARQTTNKKNKMP